MKSHYKIVIQWSDKDEYFVVSLPEWGELCHTQGSSYKEALTNAEEELELLIKSVIANGEALAEP